MADLRTSQNHHGIESKTGRRGFSMLELLVTLVMMSTLLSSVFVVLRTSRQSWEGIESDQSRLESAHATLRHLVRHLRQASEVLTISNAGDTSGSVTARMPDGEVYAWDHQGSQVFFGVDTPTAILSDGIEELQLIGYRADTATTTTTGNDISSLLVRVRVTLDRTSGAEQTLESWVWRRAW